MKIENRVVEAPNKKELKILSENCTAILVEEEKVEGLIYKPGTELTEILHTMRYKDDSNIKFQEKENELLSLVSDKTEIVSRNGKVYIKPNNRDIWFEVNKAKDEISHLEEELNQINENLFTGNKKVKEAEFSDYAKHVHNTETVDYAEKAGTVPISNRSKYAEKSLTSNLSKETNNTKMLDGNKLEEVIKFSEIKKNDTFVGQKIVSEVDDYSDKVLCESNTTKNTIEKIYDEFIKIGIGKENISFKSDNDNLKQILFEDKAEIISVLFNCDMQNSNHKSLRIKRNDGKSILICYGLTDKVNPDTFVVITQMAESFEDTNYVVTLLPHYSNKLNNGRYQENGGLYNYASYNLGNNQMKIQSKDNHQDVYFRYMAIGEGSQE